MENRSEEAVRRLTAPVKMEAAALVVGAPFYVLVVTLLLTGTAQLAALAAYGAGSGLWVAWRARRALKGGQG